LIAWLASRVGQTATRNVAARVGAKPGFFRGVIARYNTIYPAVR